VRHYTYTPRTRANWLRKHGGAGEIRNAELVLSRKDGRKIVVLENSRAVRDEQGTSLLRRHADRHHRSARVVAATVVRSSHDALSGLINRREFEMQLQRALDRRTATGRHARGVLPGPRSIQDHQRHLRHVAGDE
jgi:hypothetical protein